MGKINDARKALLAVQLQNAVVENHSIEGYKHVFVPGGVREHNYVEAKDDAEAIEKVKAVLESKIDQMAEQDAPSVVEIQPDNLEVSTEANNG